MRRTKRKTKPLIVSDQRARRLVEGIERGERAYAEGRFVTHAQAKLLMARWLRR